MSLKGEYEALVAELNSYFKIMHLDLFAKRSQSLFIGVFANWSILYSIISSVTLLYLVTNQSLDFNVKVQQIFTLVCCVQIVFRGINYLTRDAEMKALLMWFKTLYEPLDNEDYQEIVDEQLRRQNKLIRIVLRCCITVFTLGGLSYVLQPFIFKVSSIPTPVTWNGVPDTEFPLITQIVLYILFMIIVFIVVVSTTTNTAFLGITSIIIGHRFSTIGNILKLLKKPGKGDPTRTRRILKDCHVMHLDALMTIKVFRGYFDLFGLFHLGSCILINGVLLFNLNESENDMIILCLGFLSAGFSQLYLTCFFGQYMNSKVATVADILYDLDWHEFEVPQQKDLLYILTRCQHTDSLTAGNVFNLDFRLLTQITKLQASLSAFLRTMK